MSDLNLILPVSSTRDTSSGRMLDQAPNSIWQYWFMAGNNVPANPMPNGLLTRTDAITEATRNKADADYAEGAFDRLHLGQHDNGQPRTIRPQNTHYWEIRGRLLREEV